MPLHKMLVLVLVHKFGACSPIQGFHHDSYHTPKCGAHCHRGHKNTSWYFASVGDDHEPYTNDSSQEKRVGHSPLDRRPFHSLALEARKVFRVGTYWQRLSMSPAVSHSWKRIARLSVMSMRRKRLKYPTIAVNVASVTASIISWPARCFLRNAATWRLNFMTSAPYKP